MLVYFPHASMTAVTNCSDPNQMTIFSRLVKRSASVKCLLHSFEAVVQIMSDIKELATFIRLANKKFTCALFAVNLFKC